MKITLILPMVLLLSCSGNSAKESRGDTATSGNEEEVSDDFSEVSGLTEEDEKFVEASKPSQISGVNLTSNVVKIEQVSDNGEITTYKDIESTTGRFTEDLPKKNYHIATFGSYSTIVPARLITGELNPITVVLSKASTEAAKLFRILASDSAGLELIASRTVALPQLIQMGTILAKATSKNETITDETRNSIVKSFIKENKEVVDSAMTQTGSIEAIAEDMANGALASYKTEVISSTIDSGSYSPWIVESQTLSTTTYYDSETFMTDVIVDADNELSQTQAEPLYEELIIYQTVEEKVESSDSISYSEDMYDYYEDYADDLTYEDLVETSTDTEATNSYTEAVGNSETYTEEDYETYTETQEQASAEAPIPGDSGTLSITESSGSYSLNFTLATDANESSGGLTYKAYRSLADDMSSATAAEAKELVFSGSGSTMPYETPWQISASHDSGTTYYVTIVVTDSAGTKAVYDTASYSTAADPMPPVPGNSGIVNASQLTAGTLAVNFIEADDPDGDNNSMVYRLYQSDNDDMNSAADAEARTLVGTHNHGMITTNKMEVSGLIGGETKYYMVVVTDENGDKAIYNKFSYTEPGGGG